MAERALPPGALRRRTAFGLLDADGWTAAFFKALFWFLLIIFLLGYIPDRLYYFTVANTLDVGYNAIPLVNLCDPSNDAPGRRLPCPAPVGAVVPWQQSPPELALPEPRVGAAAVQSGTNLYLIGGEASGAAVADTLATQVTTDGNLGQWTEGPALPEARTRMAVTTLSGVPYVIGGLDADGAPTATVFQGIVEEGVLTGWTALDGQNDTVDLTLPVALGGAAALPAANGIYIAGGQGEEGMTPTVYRSLLGGGSPPSLGAWEEVAHAPLPEPRADATGVAIGDFLYVMGGEGPDGPTRTVYKLTVDDEGELITDPATGQPLGWKHPIEGTGGELPQARALGSGFAASGALYLIGGAGADGALQPTAYWSVPDPTSGDIARWNELPASNLPEPRSRAAITNVGSFAFAVGGETEGGPTDTSVRANLSPKLPFFRLGLFGATIPALSIKGEIGQQLGYLNAFGVGLTNFAILIGIGWAYSHRAQTMRLFERISRGRVRAPVEDEYFERR
jgi:hypothetical protein